MESLSASRLRKVLQITARAVEFRDLSEFRAGAVALVRELVPCESASYNELRPGAPPIVIADPAGWLTPESVEIFVSRRRLHGLTLYDQLYRPMGIEHQIAFVMPSPPGEVVGIALNRESHDFTGEEAAMLNLLRAPLRACYERLVEREELTSLLSRYEGREDIAVRAAALGLSERQIEVMRGVIAGSSNAEVGMALGISRRTVEKHLQNIYLMLHVTSRTQAIDRVRA